MRRNTLLERNLKVGALLKKDLVPYVEFQVVRVEGDEITIRNVYSKKDTIVGRSDLFDQFNYQYQLSEIVE